MDYIVAILRNCQAAFQSGCTILPAEVFERTLLVAQWLGVRLPVQGTRV